MKLLLYLFLISYDMAIKKAGCANILPLKHHRLLLLSYDSFGFMEWQSPQFAKSSAWYQYCWGDQASRLCSLGLDLWDELCKDWSLWPGYGLTHFGKEVPGRHPLLWLCTSEACAEKGRRNIKGSFSGQPTIFRFRWELRNKLWEWWFEMQKPSGVRVKTS